MSGTYSDHVEQPCSSSAASAASATRVECWRARVVTGSVGGSDETDYYRREAPGGPGAHPLERNLTMSTAQDLKSAGLKATLPRLRIINLFETSKLRHMTAEDVYRLLQGEGLDIGLATVYRVLTQFEQAGLLIRHHFESGKAVYELNEGKHHDHLVCLQCGRVEEFYDAEIEKRQQKVARERGFEISEHALYLYADCTKPRCPYRKP